MTAKEFLKSKRIYELAHIATQDLPEEYYLLADLLNEYLKQISEKTNLAKQNAQSK